jgi:hypothetical protein
VIICSIRGDVSFASLLAGGGETFIINFMVSFSEQITDYDGGEHLLQLLIVIELINIS